MRRSLVNSALRADHGLKTARQALRLRFSEQLLTFHSKHRRHPQNRAAVARCELLRPEPDHRATVMEFSTRATPFA
jgi:hypothetical protein